MEPDQSGGQMDVGLNAEMTRVTEESAGGSGSNQMAMLQMQLRITEMELAMERLRNENGARAAAAVQSTEADRSEDRRLRYTSLLKDVWLSGAGDSQATPINKPELAEECGGRHGSPTASAKFVCKCAPEL
ncbi:hypothetical protein HPB50_016898 [Hyalomma asiaticum]|uniref:Uncharacterized protein n=1 Tax=Hyalomma asiaticum TaxID=266040 RepID=A0ACB7T8A5_HYAAI|nr:hypothetical protein HPB50_016898 [Hyalomma asiaticum]